MKLLKFLSAAFLYLAISSCGKSSDTVKPVTPVTPVTPTPPVTPVTPPTTNSDVYIVGIVNNKATLWKNGVATTLAASSAKTTGYSVYVYGTDVYVAGYGTDVNNGNGVAILWKNGVASTLAATNPGAEANSVYVASGTVYVAGYSIVLYQNNQDYPDNGVLSYNVATLWINGAPTILSDGNKAFFDNNGILKDGDATNRESVASGVYANGSDVYVSGWEDYGAYGQVNATLWKNKNKLILYNPLGGDFTTNAPSPGFIGKFFSGDTSYIIPPNFSLNSTNEATSVFASNSGVYVAGFVTQGAYNGGIQVNAPHRATVWKNGIESPLGDSTQFANPNAVFASGNDVYAVGFNFPTGKVTPVVWKNGITSSLPYTGEGAAAKSIFVLGTDVYVVGTETISSANATYKGVMWKNGTATEFTDPANRTFIESIFVKVK